MRQLLYWIFRRVFTFLGDVRTCVTPPKVRGIQIRKAMDMAKPGDIILRAYDYYLDSIYLPGKYTHSGVVVNDQQIIHSVAEGVIKTDIIDFVCNTDRFAILKLGNVEKTAIIAKAAMNLGKEYDFLLTDPQRLYCHDHTASCLKAADIFVRQFPISILGKKIQIYTAESFLEIAHAIWEVK